MKPKKQRHGEILFFGERKLVKLIRRVQAELVDAAIAQVANTVAVWRGDAPPARSEPVTAGVEPVDGVWALTSQCITGFCRRVALAEITQHGQVLTPGRCVGAEAAQNEKACVGEKQKLTVKPGEQMAKCKEFDALIQRNRKSWGVAFGNDPKNKGCPGSPCCR